jgi:hypothetical protein
MKYFFLIPLVILFNSFVFSQKYDLEVYNLENDLKTNCINDFVKDYEGNIWIGTDIGLIKFDKFNLVDFKIILKKYDERNIRKLLIFNKKLYVIFRQGGCVELDISSEKQKLITDAVIDDLYVSNGKLFILLSTKKIIIKTSNEVKVIDIAKLYKRPISNEDYGSLVFYKKNIYVSIPKSGIYVQRHNFFDNISTKLTTPGGYREKFCVHNDSLYYVGLQLPYLINNDKFIDFKIKNYSNLVSINDVFFYNFNDFFFINGAKELLHYRNGFAQKIRFPKKSNIECRKVLVLNPESVLLATNFGLFILTKKNSFIENFSNDYSDKSKFFRVRRKILKINNDLVLFGNPISYYYNRGKLLSIHSTRNTSIYDAVSVNENLYVATEGRGILQFNKDFSKSKKINIPSDYNYFCAIYYDSKDSIVYTGDDKFVYFFKSNKEFVGKIKSPFEGYFIKVIVKDYRNHRVFVGTDNGLFIFDSKSKRVIAILRLNGAVIGDILVDYRKSLLWIGHDKGIDVLSLSKLNKVKYLSLDFFSNPRVTSIIEDDKHRIWVSTYSGILGYDFELDIYCKLTKSNGLINSEFNYKSAGKSVDGKLFFGGLEGYDIIDPNKYSFSNRTIKGFVSGYQIFGVNDTVYKKNKMENEITFNPDDCYARIYLTSDTEKNFSRSNFEFCINSGPWIDLKGKKYIDLLGLSPAYYKLKIRGVDEYGRLISFEDLNLNVVQIFYRSHFFIALILLCLVFLLILIHFKNVKKSILRKEIYNQVAMDLHDELGTILSRTILLVKSKKIIDLERRESIIEYLSDANFVLRTYINTVNINNKCLIDFFDESVEIFKKYLGINNVFFSHSFSGNPDVKINSNLYRDLKLCMHEISNNIIKHSSANKVEFIVEEKNKEILIVVKQNSEIVYFNNDKQKNGFNNIQKRIKNNHGNILFREEKNSFEIIINLKIK